MSARILLRCLVLVVSAGVLGACARQGAVSPQVAGGGGPCGGGKGSENRQAPIVCVDDRGATLSVTPDPIVLHDRLKNSSQPVVLQWFTVSGQGDLQLSIQDGCVTDLKCDGKGHCTAKARDIAAETKCKYDVWTGTHPRLDPDVVITPCC